MNEQIRALKILELIDDADMGGGQRHVFLLAEGLKRRGADISVACAPAGYLVDELAKRGIPTKSIVLENRLQPRQLFRLVKLLRDGKFTLLHTHGGTAGLWGRLASFFAGVPVRIHTYNGIHSAFRSNRIARWILMMIERMMFALTSHVICVSQGELQLGLRHRLHARESTSVIPNGIEIERFGSNMARQRVRTEFGCTDNDVLIGSVGRLHFQKGFVYLLEAAEILLRKNKNVKFVLVGDGPLGEMLREKCEKFGIGPSVYFAGTRQDIPDVLSAFDIFVLPSLWEGLPLVLLEASAAGKAIVATAIDGTKEIIRDGETGLLAPPEDPRALAEALQRLTIDTSLREELGTNTKRVAIKHFSADKMVEDTMELYISVSKKHGVI